MNYQSVDEAIHKLEDLSAGAEVRKEARQYLNQMEECEKIEGLVHALQDEDFGVRWKSAALLIKIGWNALPAILKALMDPARVGDLQLQNSVIHIIHTFQDPTMQGVFTPLLNALTGPAADIVTMREAYLLLTKIGLKDCKERN